MGFTVVYDACVLYPAPTRDLLIRIAQTGVVHARWTDQILDECFTAVRKQRPNLDGRALSRTRSLMNAAIRDVLVTGYESLIDGMGLPDPDDRHVLAAAIRCGAQTIVTWNLRDFPRTALAPYGIEARSPDDFVLNQIDLRPGQICVVVNEQAAALRNPPMTVDQLLDILRDRGLVQSVARLRELFR